MATEAAPPEGFEASNILIRQLQAAGINLDGEEADKVIVPVPAEARFARPSGRERRAHRGSEGVAASPWAVGSDDPLDGTRRPPCMPPPMPPRSVLSRVKRLGARQAAPQQEEAAATDKEATEDPDGDFEDFGGPSSGSTERSRWFDPVSKASEVYDALWRSIIRPPRSRYHAENLGPAKFKINIPDPVIGAVVRSFRRQDLQIKNNRGMMLECSHFVPINPLGDNMGSHPERARPCVIYLHGNSSCRMEAFSVLTHVVRFDVTLFCFDFAGSGLSDGDYVTLGSHEEQDLSSVIDYLRSTGTVSSIGLWGRSMGAVTAVLRTAKDRSIAACVLDSPFSSFRQLVHDVAGVYSQKLPRWVVDGLLALACKEVKDRAGFDPRELNPIEQAASCKCPALFGVANEDKLVRPENSEAVQKAWQGESAMKKFAGSHGCRRPSWFLAEGARFLAERLEAADEVELSLTRASNLYFESDECKQCREVVRRHKELAQVLDSPQINGALDSYIRVTDISHAIDDYLSRPMRLGSSRTVSVASA